ncbi:hypothetical protein [Bradyrhizobium sp. USDA 3364]
MIPDTEARLLDKGYRGRNAPPQYRFRAFCRDAFPFSDHTSGALSTVVINPFLQQAVARLQLRGMSVSNPAYLTTDEVIERYRGQISEDTFRNWRSLRIGPSFIKIGKVPLYPVDELDRWDRST